MSVTIRSIEYPATWPIRHQAMWPDRPLDYVKLPADEMGHHYGLFFEEELIAVVSVFIQGTEAQFRKFATSPAFQGNGYGSQLLTYLLQSVAEQGVQRIWCNARVEKTGFYEKFDLQITDQCFSRGGRAYVVMEKYFEGEDGHQLLT